MKTKNYRNFLLIRPLINGMKLDKRGFPIINKVNISKEDYNNLKLIRFNNLKRTIDRKYSIVEFFNFDYILDALRNDPIKYISKFHDFYAICSPDFSIYPGMNIHMIKFNVYKSRWLGSFRQANGLKIIPTIGRSYPDTYDICFSGIEKGSAVIISTLGVSKNKKIFLDGFNEMKKRINPKIIIVVGKLFPEMQGNFLLYDYDETCSYKKIYEQLLLFQITNFVNQNEGDFKNGK